MTDPEVRERIVRALPGDAIPLTVTGAPRRWTSSAEEVATIGDDGIARALAAGWSILVAEGDERSDTVLIAVGVPFVTVSATIGGHACGLTSEGVAYCWGDNYWYGQLGIGYAGTVELSPVQVATDQRFVSLSAGYEHTCGVTTAGEVFCWGDGSSGQLGTGEMPQCENQHGPRICSAIPRRVAAATPFRSVVAGHNHTCAISTADELYCWGDNGSGQLGAAPVDECQGGWECALSPIKVAFDEHVSAVALGWWRSCALTLDGRVFCWGSNEQQASGGETWEYNVDEPRLIETNLRFDTIAAGSYHTCALTADERVHCWGDNYWGQLGLGQAVESSATPRTVPRLAGIHALSADFEKTCALRTDGTVACWGNLEGIEELRGNVRFRMIANAGYFACGVGTDAVPYCWGSNAPGLGVAASRALPTPIAPPGPLPHLIGSQ